GDWLIHSRSARVSRAYRGAGGPAARATRVAGVAANAEMPCPRRGEDVRLPERAGPLPAPGGGRWQTGGRSAEAVASAVGVQQSARLSGRERGDQYTSPRGCVQQFAIFHSNVCLAQPFESIYRCAAGRPSRGADVTTTADS